MKDLGGWRGVNILFVTFLGGGGDGLFEKKNSDETGDGGRKVGS